MDSDKVRRRHHAGSSLNHGFDVAGGSDSNSITDKLSNNNFGSRSNARFLRVEQHVPSFQRGF